MDAVLLTSISLGYWNNSALEKKKKGTLQIVDKEWGMNGGQQQELT